MVIDELIKRGELDKAMEMLDREIEENPLDALLWYRRGRLYWRLGQKAKAISDYEESVHLDPYSPARFALEMANDVMDFCDPDLVNP